MGELCRGAHCCRRAERDSSADCPHGSPSAIGSGRLALFCGETEEIVDAVTGATLSRFSLIPANRGGCIDEISVDAIGARSVELAVSGFHVFYESIADWSGSRE